jgi:hypothetical protein
MPSCLPSRGRTMRGITCLVPMVKIEGLFCTHPLADWPSRKIFWNNNQLVLRVITNNLGTNSFNICYHMKLFVGHM